MLIPEPVFYPPFNITRVSHLVLTVREIARSVEFYTEVFGLVVTAQDSDTAFLRGIDETCHHSLVLKRSSEPPTCQRVGFRVLTELELDKAEAFFRKAERPIQRIEVPGQGATLQTSDPGGAPIEFCARMERQVRRSSDVNSHKGGVGLRFDHLQIQTPFVRKSTNFYSELGFRVSDYLTAPGSEELQGAFMYRKDNPWDIVFVNGLGPRLHHFGYIVPSAHEMFRACDVAGLLNFGKAVERGPGRHAMGHVQFVYIRDPDGHRGELLLDAPHQMLDLENEPVRWDVFGHHTAKSWGLPAQRTWFEEATPFEEVPQSPPLNASPPYSLEDYLGERQNELRV